MQKNIFAENIVAIIRERHGLEAEINETTKNNGVVLTALVIDNGLNVRPNVYIDEFYKRYENGQMCLPEIADEVVELSRTHEGDIVGGEQLGSFITDWESVKGQVFVSVRNAKMNEEILADVPHKIRCDLAVMYRVGLKLPEGEGSVLINNRLMEIWDVSLDELDDIAWKNTRRQKPYELRGMVEVLKKIMGADNVPDEMFGMPDDPMGMHVLSNKDGINGAVFILDYTTLYSIKEDLGWDRFYILPSSVHELILLPADGDIDPSELFSMVSTVNQQEVPPEDILSYSVYKYDEGELFVYDGEEWSMAA